MQEQDVTPLPHRPVRRTTGGAKPNATSELISNPSDNTEHPDYRDGRPPVLPAASLGRSRTPVIHMAGIFGLVLFVYLLLLPHFLMYSSPPTGDQPHYMMVTMSLIQDGDLNLVNNYAQYDENKFYGLAPRPPGFVGIEAPFPLPPHPAFSVARPSTELYNFHFPGLSVMLIPAWILGGWFELWWPMSVAFICLLGALVALNVFLLAHEVSGRLWIAWVVAISLAFTNPLMSYSYLIFTEIPTALFVIYAFRRLSLGWNTNGPWRLALIGLCIIAPPWLNWRGIVLSGLLGLYAAIQWWRYYRKASTNPESETKPPPERGPRKLLRTPHGPRAALPLLAPILLLGGLLLWHNYFLFGAPTPPGSVPELGPGVSPFKAPWAGMEQFTHFVYNIFGHLFDRPMGLVTNTPLYILSFVGLIALFRSRSKDDRKLLLGILLIAAPFTALISAFVFWNGIWNPPARFLTTVAPLMAAPLAFSLYAVGGGLGWIYRALFALLAIPGFLFMALRMHDARMFWPGNPISGWLYENNISPFRGDLQFALGFDHIFPAFSPVEELRLPLNTAWMTASALFIVILSYIIMSRRRANYHPLTHVLPTAAHYLLWVTVIAVVATGWFLINREYLRPRTMLIENTRWGLFPPPVQAEGITYLNGNIFVADYRGGSVGKLAIGKSAYEPLTITQTQTMAFSSPGDVTVGPDGLLYVINNGPGENALYILDPEGLPLYKARLEGTSTVVVGAAFAPDGSLYVSDMVGGRIVRYGNRGGTPLTAFTPPARGFNNVKGLAIAPDGTIYAAEIGNGLIHRFNPDTTYNREYKLNNCKPLYLALSGEWLDISCEGKLISLNTASGETRSIMVENSNQPQGPNGITYGPDGTLYVLDRNIIVAYTVRR